MFWKISIIVILAFVQFSFVQFSYASAGEKQIRIIGLESGSVVDGDNVSLDLAMLDPNGHLHFYLDGKMKFMIDSAKLKAGKLIVGKVVSGKHTFKVVLSGKHHMESKGDMFEDSIILNVK